MGGSLIALGIIALLFSRSKKGWDRDCLIGGTLAIGSGILISWIG